ncbi:class I SAM-dependent methyltransferase [Novosphingobium umbonatum]|uniref:Class I SAM-dependent methyltransferase n=1 Tax=Novosphingobium umbonatum TaxID=1908524 RepID=A0A3S2Y4X6_9SPHN|nr:class I SAM-dependent methyltransferase [Novosphingobium umbonatum]RVU03579.1 class I SAM-dependent methyltransferase [Novosphingobium umbonatum]
MNLLKAIGDGVKIASTVAGLREPAFRICDRMQDIHPSDQVRALFLAAAVTAEAVGVDPHDEIERARRMCAQAEGPHTYHVQAIRDYAAEEIVRKDRNEVP